VKINYTTSHKQNENVHINGWYSALRGTKLKTLLGYNHFLKTLEVIHSFGGHCIPE